MIFDYFIAAVANKYKTPNSQTGNMKHKNCGKKRIQSFKLYHYH